MTHHIHRYQFPNDIPIEEIEASLLLAIFAAENLHGESLVRLDAAHAMDRDRRVCVIDANTQVGRDINQLFIGFVRREFGEDSFRVERVDSCSKNPVSRPPHEHAIAPLFQQ